MNQVMQDIGKQLADARIAKGLDTAQAARQLKIRKAFLEAMEEGNFAELPGREVYITGIITAYGKFLGANTDTLVEQYKAISSGHTPAEDFKFPEYERHGVHPIAVILAAGLLTGIGTYMYFQNQQDIHGFIGNQVSSISDKVNAIEQKGKTIEEAARTIVEPAKPTTVTPTAPAQDADAETISAAPMAEENEHAAVKEASKQDTAKVPEPGTISSAHTAVTEKPNEKAANALEASATPAVTAPEASADQKGTVDKYASADKSNRVILLAKEDTWVKVTDGKASFITEKVLKAGDTFFLPEKKNLLISAGNAEAIEVFLEGEEHTFLGTLNDLSKKQSAVE